MQIDPFFQVPQHPVHTSAGVVNLPVLYKEGDYCVALFTAPRAKVEALLQGTHLTPAMTFGPYATVAMVMSNFNICSEAPYSVVAFAIPASRERGFQPVSPWRELFARPDQRHMGFYMLNCPVNSLRMMAVGREVWGHPKSPASIQLELNDSRLDCAVDCMERGTRLLRFSGSGMRFWRIGPLGFNLFTVRNHQLVRSIIDTRSPFNVHVPFNFKLQLGAEDHPITNPLRQLGLDGKRPLALISSNEFQGRFNEGTVIEDLDSPQPLTKLRPAATTLRV